MSDTDLFLGQYVPCRLCRARYLNGQAFSIAVWLCIGCKLCRVHCPCGAARQLERVEAIEALEAEADQPVVVENRV